MPSERRDAATRRSVVPSAAGRSLWRAAMWTGAGVAVVGATVAIVAVAICWLPTSASSGSGSRMHSTIHAGLLLFLAALHGGVTVDGSGASFLPLGLLLVIGAIAWRAGAGLADAAEANGETDPGRLALAGLIQSGTFAVAALVAVPFAALGTSRVPILGVGAAAWLLFALAGGGALVRYSALSDWVAERCPAPLTAAGRVARPVLVCYLGAGLLLVVASVLVHHGRVAELTGQVGGGWSSVPVLALCLLALPNAVIAAVGYLAGPGFAIGTGTAVGPFGAAHGTLPAFPLLGAVPSGNGADLATWLVMALTPVLAGALAARRLWRLDGWRQRLRVAGAAAGVLAVTLAVLAWQGGGGIGSGRLRTVGVSPWQLGLMVPAAVGLVTGVLLAAAAAARLAGTGRMGGTDRLTGAEPVADPEFAAEPTMEPIPAAEHEPSAPASAAERLAKLGKTIRATPRRRPPDDAERPDELAG